MWYALADGFRQVGVRHIQAAQAVWAYCDASCRYIFGDALGDPDADEILRALRQAGSVGLTRSEISSDVFGRHRSAAFLTRALETLLRDGLVHGEVDNSGAGRPVERWYVA